TYLANVDKENQYCGNPINIPEKKKEQKKDGEGAGTPAGPGGAPSGVPGGVPGAGGPPGLNLAAVLGVGGRDYFFRPPKGIGAMGEETTVKEDLLYKFVKEAPPAKPAVPQVPPPVEAGAAAPP